MTAVAVCGVRKGPGAGGVGRGSGGNRRGAGAKLVSGREGGREGVSEGGRERGSEGVREGGSE
jgi:hypothetical protein